MGSLAACWKALLVYETDGLKRLKMCRKRARLLGDLAEALNPAVYRVAVGELAWGAGLAWVEAMDAASGYRGGGGGNRHADAAAASAVAAFGLFLRGFEDPRWPAPPLGLEGAPAPAWAGAAPVDAESEEQYAMAHFLCSRALFRRRAPGAARACLARCTWFLHSLLPKLSAGVASKLECWAEVARQLVVLLPQKIEAGL